MKKGVGRRLVAGDATEAAATEEGEQARVRRPVRPQRPYSCVEVCALCARTVGAAVPLAARQCARLVQLRRREHLARDVVEVAHHGDVGVEVDDDAELGEIPRGELRVARVREGTEADSFEAFVAPRPLAADALELGHQPYRHAQLRKLCAHPQVAVISGAEHAHDRERRARRLQQRDRR